MFGLGERHSNRPHITYNVKLFYWQASVGSAKGDCRSGFSRSSGSPAGPSPVRQFLIPRGVPRTAPKSSQPPARLPATEGVPERGSQVWPRAVRFYCHGSPTY